MTVPPGLRGQVRAWIEHDPDPDTQAELRTLLAAAESDTTLLGELADRFRQRLEFATAGLRGELAAGPNRMNRAVVLQTAAGLSSYLIDTLGAGTVVVGFDARHNSDVFARDTAAVLHGAGLGAVVLPRPLPTPLLAFAIRRLGCVGGVMVTASHNPPRDNGYKVYLGDGSQIVPPVDGDISARIDAVGPPDSIPRAAGWQVLDESIVEAYVDALAQLPDADGARGLALVYTPLHGVGNDLVVRTLTRAGFAPPLVVPEQARPDPDFPTVAFPNPEEPGAMDLAIKLAAATGADLVVANDPDADRCAAAVPDVRGWRMLRGDEVGALLADALLRKGVGGVFATTIVSSSLLARMAFDHGVEFAETLTGFKWIGRVPGLAFGYEEALGYCVAPDLVRDKDGISALLLLAELAAGLKAHGRTLVDQLDEIEQAYGVHATDQLSVRVADLSVIAQVLQRLRAHPPAQLGGFAVENADDLATGSPGLPPTEGLRYRLRESGRVVVRPSGTEPKLKCYLEAVVPVGAGGLAAARRVAADRLGAIRRDLVAAAGLPPG